MRDKGDLKSEPATVKGSGIISVRNVNEAFGSESVVEFNETDILKLGKWVLIWLAIICIGVFIGYGYSPENKALADIFELIKIGALPLVTLIISFYFPNSK